MPLLQKVSKELTRLRVRIGRYLIQSSRVTQYRVLSTNKIQGHPRRLQPVQCVGKGCITVDDSVRIGYFPSPYFYSGYAYLEARRPSAAITIGKNTLINNNFVAIAEQTQIRIGKNCLIGTGVEIIDSDFHSLRQHRDETHREVIAKPVTIGDHVFIGSNVRIMKGVSIGDKAVIANSAVVTSDIPAAVIAGGNPARVIKPLDEPLATQTSE